MHSDTLTVMCYVSASHLPGPQPQVVIAVAIFSSLPGLLMGLDIGYIAGVKQPVRLKYVHGWTGWVEQALNGMESEMLGYMSWDATLGKLTSIMLFWIFGCV